LLAVPIGLFRKNSSKPKRRSFWRSDLKLLFRIQEHQVAERRHEQESGDRRCCTEALRQGYNLKVVELVAVIATSG
jgi:hypothetical protein